MHRKWSLHIQPPVKTLLERMGSPEADLVIKSVEFACSEKRYVMEIITDHVHKYIAATGRYPTKVTIDDQHYKVLVAELAMQDTGLLLPDKITIAGVELDICISPYGLGVCGNASDDFLFLQQKKLYATEDN